VPCILGAEGIEKIVDVPFSADEKAALANSAEEVRKGIADLSMETVAK